MVMENKISFYIACAYFDDQHNQAYFLGLCSGALTWKMSR